MAEKSALHGVDAALAYIDESIASLAEDTTENETWRTDEVVEILNDIRARLVDRPEWSQVVESNLRHELAERVKDIAHMDVVLENMRGSRDSWRAQVLSLTSERDHARTVSVLLHQALDLTEALLHEARSSRVAR